MYSTWFSAKNRFQTSRLGLYFGLVKMALSSLFVIGYSLMSLKYADLYNSTSERRFADLRVKRDAVGREYPLFLLVIGCISLGLSL